MKERRAAIITGAARRLGSFLAIHMASAGYDIFLHYNESTHDAHQVKTLIETQLDRLCMIYQADLTHKSAPFALIDKAFEFFPQCNILVNNASTFNKISFVECNPEQFDDNIALHLRTPFFLIQQFSKRCTKRGHIINMLDYALKKEGLLSYFPYMLSKLALENLTEMLKKKLNTSLAIHSIYPAKLLAENENAENESTINLCKEVIKIITALNAQNSNITIK